MDSTPVTPPTSQALKKCKKSPTPREATRSRYTVQDEHEQLHYYMDLKQYMPPANQLRFIGSVEEIQAKDSNLVPAFTHIRKNKTRVIHPEGFLQQSALLRKEDGYGPKDLPTSTEAQFSRLTRRTNKL